ncbi:MAG: hypothetical protein AB7J40_00965 [Candidatus Altimarinota bacterium]
MYETCPYGERFRELAVRDVDVDRDEKECDGQNDEWFAIAYEIILYEHGHQRCRPDENVPLLDFWG